MSRVIVSFTTIPARLPYLEPVIKCICEEQTVKPDSLILYVPEIFTRTNEPYIVPEYLTTLTSTYPQFSIRRVEDKGPITKVYYALDQFRDPTDIIISIDDDILYDSHFIEEFLDAHKTHPSCLLAFMGIHAGKFVHSEIVQHGKSERAYHEVDSVGGYRGILYPRGIVGDTFFTHASVLNGLHLSENNTNMLNDDSYISNYFTHMKVPMYVVGTFYPRNIYARTIYEIINITITDISKLDSVNYSILSDKTYASHVKIEDYFNKLSLN
jgi:hypothetical protein